MSREAVLSLRTLVFKLRTLAQQECILGPGFEDLLSKSREAALSLRTLVLKLRTLAQRRLQ